MASNATAAAFGVFVQPPLYTVLPASIAFFYAAYFFVTPQLLARRCAGQHYAHMDQIEKACFHANIGSAFHSYAVVLLMIAAFATDARGLSTPSNRLGRYYNPIGYATMCVTLGYFSLSVPWNLYMRFRERRSDVAPLPMLVHHCMVVAGALVYVLGGVCAFYGAIAFACMELTNLFFIPRVIAEMAGWHMGSPLCTVNGLCLVITFVVFRVGTCTGIAILFTSDLAHFASPHPAEWVLVIFAYAIFMGVLVLSWIWLRRVLKELSDGVKVLLQQRRALRVQRNAAAAAAAAASASKPAVCSPEACVQRALAAPACASLPPPPRRDAPEPYCPSRGGDQDSAASSSSASHARQPLAPSPSPCALPQLPTQQPAPLPLGAGSRFQPGSSSPSHLRPTKLDPLPPAAATSAAAICPPPTSSRSRGLKIGSGARIAPA